VEFKLATETQFVTALVLVVSEIPTFPGIVKPCVLPSIASKLLGKLLSPALHAGIEQLILSHPLKNIKSVLFTSLLFSPAQSNATANIRVVMACVKSMLIATSLSAPLTVL